MPAEYFRELFSTYVRCGISATASLTSQMASWQLYKLTE
jgi:hypothetical protein